MYQRRIAVFLVTVAVIGATAVAGIRSEGKYSGVVIFDRWGGCTLYGGVFVMYISEAVKEQLRAETNKCVQIDATEVEQPLNPGDGLIKKFTLLGRAPAAANAVSPEGLKISAAPDFNDGRVPRIVIRVENVSDKPRTLQMESLAPTFLTTQPKDNHPFSPSDGPSVAAVTRTSYWMDGPRMKEEGTRQSVPYQWTVTAPRTLEKSVVLQPKGVFELHLSFKMPVGEYEFLTGYGGGMNVGECIASNLIPFDVTDDGKVSLAKIGGR